MAFTLAVTLEDATVASTDAGPATMTLVVTLGQLTSVGDESAPTVATPTDDEPVAAAVPSVYPRRAWPL